MNLASQRKGEIVGLRYGTNGRSCTQYDCCGAIVVPGTILKLHFEVIDVEGAPEDSMKAVVIGDDHFEYCTVGFLSRNFALSHRDMYDNKTVEVLEMYHQSASAHKRAKDHGNGGVASFKFIDDIATINN